ncbi:MAG: alginate lyase family protein [Hellea sp.]|nr:alginate lyase family protein [Hellea sp.]
MRLKWKNILAAVLTGSVAACAPSSETAVKTTAATSVQSGASFETTMDAAKDSLSAQMSTPLIIPVPKDAGGGYTHEQHKKNAKLIYDAGQLYKLTGETQYADFASKAMLDYAEVYPSWGLHPAKKEQDPGRMFWQNLNESMWLLHVAQSYGAIKDTVSPEQREKIETDLLRNMADFMSEGSPTTFNKIHNHGTWATAAVGLTGYAIGDDDYVEQALMGLDKSGDAGFLKQMDRLFSPDGYYNEGPYYQRFALKPFVIFAQAVEKNNPERKIFEQRDGILKKAIYTTIHQNYGGLFFPINDAIKEKGISTNELLHGVAIAYELTGDKGLLSIAQAQNTFVLTPESRKLSQDLAAGMAEPFDYKSMRLGDGEDGTDGALDILRASADPNGLAVVAKNTSQGLGHGHFDKLGLLVYDAGHEILRDYGAARFLNVEAKYGGHYLPENNAYAKQTIAHNALVVDETSHFNGDVRIGNVNAPELGAFVNDGALKATTAEISTAYDGVVMSRTVAIIEDDAFPGPVIVDLVEGHAEGSHQYDLPFHYNGHMIETNFKVAADPVSLVPLGDKNGYQFLWKLAEATPIDGLSQITFLLDRKFYSVTSSVPDNTSIIFAETGAGDPNFSLRHEPAFILRCQSTDGVSYASVIEPHGDYNPVVEYTLDSHSHVKTVSHFETGADEFVLIETKDGRFVGLGISGDPDTSISHTVSVNGADKTWTGPYKLFHSTQEGQ